EHTRVPDRHAAYLKIKQILDGLPESAEKYDAWALANDLLGITVQLRAGVSRTDRGMAMSPKLMDAGDRLERSVLAGVRKHPKLNSVLAKLGPQHFGSEVNRRLVAVVLGAEEPDPELKPLLAELDARVEAEGIDERTTEQLLLRLRER